MPTNFESPIPDLAQTKRLGTSLSVKWIALAVALCACGAYAYFLMFSRFGFWDDEGYLMATVRAMLQGHLLYDQIYTLYGPFYYFFEGALYVLTGLPVTHDFVRFVGLFFWLASAGLAAWSVLRLTRSFLLAGLTLFAVSKVLVFFSGEPGHPEELCIVCVCLLLALATMVNSRLSGWNAIFSGFLLAALSLTKINIGLYAIWAVLLTYLSTHPASQIKRLLFFLVGLGSIGCTAIIMLPLLGSGWVNNYLLLIVFSILASLTAVSRNRPETIIGARAWYLLTVAFVTTGLAVVVPFLVHGTTMSALLYISVLQHKNFAREWFVSAPFTPKSTLWAVLSLALAALWSYRRLAPSQSKTFEAGLQALKGAIAVFGTIYLLTMYPEHTYGVRLLKLVTPFNWLVVVIPSSQGKDSRFFARVFLCFLGVFVALYPFPVASAQLLFALVPLIVVIAVFWHDAFVALAAVVAGLNRRNTRRALSATAMLLLAGVYAKALHGAQANYAALVPLRLPGAANIHVTPREADTYRWVTDELDRHCASFFSMPGMFSFHFWTGKDTPTMMMMNDWPGFLNASQQQVVVRDLAHNHTSCVISNPGITNIFLRGQDMSESPVARYIYSHFREIAERNGYHLLVRKD
ncbi:MAG TPA: hypothetical protein VLJ11_10845 [Bryobacteraceae bacterium]|nr:hypothetical protein [Bryobacteraceae bacterium]